MSVTEPLVPAGQGGVLHLRPDAAVRHQHGEPTSAEPLWMHDRQPGTRGRDDEAEGMFATLPLHKNEATAAGYGVG
jgi:hypothetical protein